MSLACRLRGAFAPALAVTLGGLAVAACSGGGELRCEEPGPYVTSRSAPPLRVPDELSVPDESEALTVPRAGDDSGDSGGDEAGDRCLERPPDYFEGGAPQGASG